LLAVGVGLLANLIAVRVAALRILASHGTSLPGSVRSI
jgi:hypothetical protein